MSQETKVKTNSFFATHDLKTAISTKTNPSVAISSPFKAKANPPRRGHGFEKPEIGTKTQTARRVWQRVECRARMAPGSQEPGVDRFRARGRFHGSADSIMNVAFMGSVSSSYHTLAALIKSGVELTGVLGLDRSIAPRVSDYRDLEPLATNAGIPFRSFKRTTEPDVAKFLQDHPPDLLFVIGLSQLVSDALIGLTRHGAIGFHPTMLPQGRGRAPVAWTILLGAPAAVSLFYLSDEADSGDLIIQREVPVLPDDYSEDLIARTNQRLEVVIAELAPAIKSGQIPRTPQDHTRATHYAKRTPEDGLIDWQESTDRIYRLIRAAGRPYPGAFAFVGEEKLTIQRAQLDPVTDVENSSAGLEPGEIASVDENLGAKVRTVDGELWLTETTPIRATQLRPGSILRSAPTAEKGA